MWIMAGILHTNIYKSFTNYLAHLHPCKIYFYLVKEKECQFADKPSWAHPSSTLILSTPLDNFYCLHSLPSQIVPQMQIPYSWYFSGGGKFSWCSWLRGKPLHFLPMKQYHNVPGVVASTKIFPRTGQKFTPHENFITWKIPAIWYTHRMMSLDSHSPGHLRCSLRSVECVWDQSCQSS